MGKEERLKIRFLGGVGEIGKNMTAFEFGSDIIVVDAGLSFPTQDMPGIDLVVPDITYLINNKERVKGIFITHGHEDHIGGIQYLLKEVNAPVYGTELSLSLIEYKLKEAKIPSYSLNCVEPRSTVTCGVFSVEFINVNHSIPQSCALAIYTPIGTILHTGDFKIDLTPLSGDIIDITRLTEIGKKGVLLMLCESTNVEDEGYTSSESLVYNNLDRIFSLNRHKRIIVTAFASNVFRMQQIFNLAYKFKKKVVVFGKTMLTVINAAREIGELVIPENTLITQDEIRFYQQKDLVILSTGSQGEPMSALARMAAGDFPQIIIGENDTVIISASIIPGNQKSVYSVINNLYRKGAEVLYEENENIHASGHACIEELKMMHSIISPKFFIPIHGEYRHLKKHIELAKSLGMKDSNMLICDIGDTVVLSSKHMKMGQKFPSGSRYIDGISIDDSQINFKDRKHLSEDGIIVAVCCVSAENGLILQGPDIIGRGAGLTAEDEKEIKDIIIDIVNSNNVKESGEYIDIRPIIRRKLKDYILKKTKKNPMILPIITKV